MSSVTRKAFGEEFSGQTIDVGSLQGDLARLRRAGIDKSTLDMIAGQDGLISGKEWNSLFDSLDGGDHDGSTETVDLPSVLVDELREEITRQRAFATDRTVGATYIFDRSTNKKTLVDGAAYEAERGKLQRHLTHLLSEIPADRRAVMKEYPYQAVNEMYTEAEEALKRAVSYYAKGDLLMAGAWATQANRYSDIEGKAHRILVDEGAFAHVGKRLASAGVGLAEGSAGAFLSLIDKGAALVGAKPALSDWNARQYQQIQAGLGSLTGMDHAQLPDAAIGRMGGELATALAIGKGFKDAGALGQTVLAIASAGGARANLDALKDLHARGASWAEIFSQPANVARLASAVGGLAGIAGKVPELKAVCDEIGLVASAAQMAALTTDLVTISNDASLSAGDRNAKLARTLGALLSTVAGRIDKEYGSRFDRWAAGK